jgi:hypothetical protein
VLLHRPAGINEGSVGLLLAERPTSSSRSATAADKQFTIEVLSNANAT